MKAFNSTLNYAYALANCLALGGDLAQPMNDLESETLSIVLSNFTNSTLGSYWIGKLISFEFKHLNMLFLSIGLISLVQTKVTKEN
jgi:hypothetical protein